MNAPAAQPRLRGPRVTLAPWAEVDREAFAAMNADAEVMRHFPAALDRAASDTMADRVAAHVTRRGYGWWALLDEAGAFAGGLGLIDAPFDLPGLPMPQVEIGWRLARHAWGRGLATEGARLALAHARDALRLARVVSFATVGNAPSIAVMRRIGLVEAGRFEHPRLPEGHPIRPHVVFATPPGWARAGDGPTHSGPDGSRAGSLR